MGAYVYKVSSKPFMTFQGEPVYKSTYAYKPYYAAWDAEKANREMAFTSGAMACERWWKKKTSKERTDVLIEHCGRIYRVPYCDGAVIDDWAFDRTPVHIMEEK